MQGEKRVISVLFADLKHFSAYCGTYRDDPARIVLTLTRKFDLAQTVIDTHGGCLDKFDGDAVIAFWNGLEPQADHAARALAAAVELLRDDRTNPNDDLSFKCAVATGVAFVGRYGSTRKSSFSVIGEPINLAARLEALCRPHGLDLIVSERTAEMVGGLRPPGGVKTCAAPELERVGEATLKGFAAPVPFFTVKRLNG